MGKNARAARLERFRPSPAKVNAAKMVAEKQVADMERQAAATAALVNAFRR